MKRVLAQFTEWTWCDGKIRTADELDAAASRFLDWLDNQFPRQGGSRQLALTQIRHDMLRTYRVLSYGGRDRTQVMPARRERLLAEAAGHRFEHLK